MESDGRGFLKDWERLSRSGRYDVNRLKAIMLDLIANERPPGPERRDHALKGARASDREGDVGGSENARCRTTLMRVLAVQVVTLIVLWFLQAAYHG